MKKQLDVSKYFDRVVDTKETNQTSQKLNFLSGQKSKSIWNLTYKVKSYQQIEAFFQDLREVEDLSELLLHWNGYSNILYAISLPVFTHLKSLNIGGNNIESIEKLQNLQIINLEQLYLWNNKVTSINSLLKIQMPLLKILDLSQNLISSLDKIWLFHVYKLINLDMNKISNLTPLLKIRNFPQYGKALFCDNLLINICGSPFQTEKKISFQCNFKNTYKMQLSYYSK